MKTWMRITSTACAAALFCAGFSGCDNHKRPSGAATPTPAPTAAATAAPVGNWVESAVLGPLAIEQSPAQLSDGSLMLYSKQTDGESTVATGFSKFTSADGGKTWQSEAAVWGQDTPKNWHAFAIAPSGKVLLQRRSVVTEPKKHFAYDYFLCAPDGTQEQLDFSGIENFNHLVANNVWFLREDLLAVAPYVYTTSESFDLKGNAWLYDLGTKQAAGPYICHAAPLVGSQETLSGKSSVYNEISVGAVGPDATLYFSYRANYATLPLSSSPTLAILGADGTITDSGAAISAKDTSVATCDAEGNYYYVNEDGLYCLAKGSAQPVLLIAGGSFAFTAESSYCSSICRTSDGDFLAAVVTGAGSTLYRYHLDNA